MIARKEQAYLRRHPGTLNSTMKYLAFQYSMQKRVPKRNSVADTSWIDAVVEEFHNGK